MIGPFEMPLTSGACATLACVWEATAPKPGNVYRGADFEDLTYADFLTSAALIGPVIDKTMELGVGNAIKQAVIVTRSCVGSNTNLGILLLIAPLAVACRGSSLATGIGPALDELTVEDTQAVFEAIRIAQPSGLGKSEKYDVHSESEDLVTLPEVMALATDRDLIARQYVNSFAQVFELAEKLEHAIEEYQSLSPAIVEAFLKHLAEYPDSLIARKCGTEFSREVSDRAAQVLSKKQTDERQIAEFDFWLRADGHRRNPGTTADFIAAALFVLLREGRLSWPVQFY